MKALCSVIFTEIYQIGRTKVRQKVQALLPFYLSEPFSEHMVHLYCHDLWLYSAPSLSALLNVTCIFKHEILWSAVIYIMFRVLNERLIYTVIQKCSVLQVMVIFFFFSISMNEGNVVIFNAVLCWCVLENQASSHNTLIYVDPFQCFRLVQKMRQH